MRISELQHVMHFVKDAVIDPGIPNLFQVLISVLEQNARMRPNQSPQPITDQKANVIAAVRDAKPSTLSLNERRLLQTYIDTALMANSGVERINQIFSEHNLDPMGAVNAFTQLKQEYEKLVSSATSTLAVLEPLSISEIETDIEDGRAVLQVTFKDRASIASVTDWHESADQWWQIIRSFGLLTDTTTDQAKILSFQQGSIIVEVSAVYVLIKSLGLAADKILSVIERLLDLRKKIHEIKQLDLTNKQIERDLEKEAEAFQENKGNQIAQQVVEEINKNKLTDGEVMNAIQIAVKSLFVFLDKGGTIDCRLKAANEQPQDALSLKTVYDGIRQLETRIDDLKLLSDGKKQ